MTAGRLEEHLNRARERADAPVVVVGGANVDVKCVLDAPAIPGTSNPGRTGSSLGGVGRNVAENLARLGVRAQLIAAVGRDAFGEQLLTETGAAGVDVKHTLRSGAPTGTYTAVLGPDGELLIAVAAMGITDDLTPEALARRRGVLAGAALIVVDGNPGPEALRYVLETAESAGVPVIAEPVSVPKAAKFRDLLRGGAHVTLVTPNRDELAVLAGQDTGTDEEVLRAARALLELNVLGVWVRLGVRGGLLVTHEGAHALHPFPARVVDVTGAGDASLAGFAYALLRGHDPRNAARYGHAAAALTVTTARTVNPDLTPEALERTITNEHAQGDTP